MCGAQTETNSLKLGLEKAGVTVSSEYLPFHGATPGISRGNGSAVSFYAWNFT